MRYLALAVLFLPLLVAQTADELVAKNLQAKGGIEKIKAIKSLRMTGKMQAGPMAIAVTVESMTPNLLRQDATIQGMTQIQAYDGSSGWQISPFQGRKDPELLGEDDMRSLVEEADFYGALVDYKTKDNRIEYLGLDTVDGDDAYRLKVTLANGDLVYYYLDPDTYLEIRTERVQYIRGSVRETYTNLGSYKQVAGVYFPFSLEAGSKQNPGEGARITFDKIEANPPIPPQQFKMPAAPAGGKEL
ncbi:MAG TPA: hypothetical protein VGH38_37870 [Bryobacteraceae bacterium]